MASADHVKALIWSHAEGDDERFYAIANAGCRSSCSAGAYKNSVSTHPGSPQKMPRLRPRSPRLIDCDELARSIRMVLPDCPDRR